MPLKDLQAQNAATELKDIVFSVSGVEVFTDTLKTKLEKIETNANLVTSTSDVPEGSRLYHTPERVRGTVAGFVVEGNGISITHDDANDNLTISAGIDVSEEGSQVKAQAYAVDFTGSAVTAQNDGTGKVSVSVDPPVDSVNGFTGSVTLDADDLSDASTTNKFTDQAGLDKLAVLAPENTTPSSPQVLKYTGSLFENAQLDYSELTGTPALATVATSGDWADLTGREEWLGYALSDESSDISTGFALSDHVVGARTIKELRAGIQQGSEPSDQKILIDLHKNGSSILSTRLQIDVGEDSSVTAANQPVFSDTSLADDDYIEFYIDQTGGTTPGKALKVRIRTEV